MLFTLEPAFSVFYLWPKGRKTEELNYVSNDVLFRCGFGGAPYLAEHHTQFIHFKNATHATHCYAVTSCAGWDV